MRCGARTPHAGCAAPSWCEIWLPWQTAVVAWDGADFWLVAGTAAPVVALAAVVSLGDAQREHIASIGKATALIYGEESSGDDRIKGMVLTNKTIKAAKRLYSIGLANVWLQAALLAVSLVSLARKGNLVPPWIAIVAAVGGLLLLAYSALGAVQLRWTRMNELAERPGRIG